MLTRISTAQAIENLFSIATLARWNKDEVYMFHLLFRDTEMFCCVEEVWWKADYHFFIIKDGGEEFIFVRVNSVERVEPPSDVTYSYSLAMRWSTERDGPFSAESKETVEWLMSDVATI